MRMPLVWANSSCGISIMVSSCFLLMSACSALQVGRWRERRLQRREFARQHVAQNVHMRNDVGAGDEAKIELVAIALHGDVQGETMGRDRHREDVQQFGARGI